MKKNPMIFALKLAHKCIPLGEVPVGCVITNDSGEIISSATNSILKTNDPTAHAEINAIRKACKKQKSLKLKNVSLYVTLEPCEMCKFAIISAGIKKVFFGAYTENHEILKRKEKNYNLEKKGYQFFGGIEEKKCSDLIKFFFKGLR